MIFILTFMQRIAHYFFKLAPEVGSHKLWSGGLVWRPDSSYCSWAVILQRGVASAQSSQVDFSSRKSSRILCSVLSIRFNDKLQFWMSQLVCNQQITEPKENHACWPFIATRCSRVLCWSQWFVPAAWSLAVKRGVPSLPRAVHVFWAQWCGAVCMSAVSQYQVSH